MLKYYALAIGILAGAFMLLSAPSANCQAVLTVPADQEGRQAITATLKQNRDALSGLTSAEAIPLSDGKIGEDYTADLFSVVPGVSAALAGGELPPGLTLNGATGVIAGVPETAGDYIFTIAIGSADPRSGPSEIEFSIRILAPTEILEDPSDAQVCPESEARFTVTASGTDLLYKWQRKQGSAYLDLANDEVYAGVLSDELTIKSATPDLDGMVYRCVVQGACPGDARSNFAALHIAENPEIVNEPRDAQACAGGDVNIAVTVNGVDVIYQWQVDDGSGFRNLSADGMHSMVNSPTLVIANLNTGMSGYQYRCLIQDGCDNSAETAVANLTVEESPAIQTQPVDDEICVGENSGFNVGTDETAVEYQWQVDKGQGFRDLTNDRVHSEVNSAALVISGAESDMDGWRYRCVVAGECKPGSKSEAATLAVSSSPLADFGFVVNGTSVEFENRSLHSESYQWDFGDNSGRVSSESPTHTFTGPGSYDVRLTVNGPCGTHDTVITIELLTTAVDDEPSALSLSIYPNPSAGIVTVNCAAAEPGQVQVSVEDIRGRSMVRRWERIRNQDQIQLDLRSLPPGEYVVRLEGGEWKWSTMLRIVR